jgi:PQQ-dependent catabolism-associated beta-propeller protein
MTDYPNAQDIPRMSSPCVSRALALAALVLPLWAQAQGTAWISSEKDHAITLIDMKSLAVVGTVPTCKRPRHMQVAPGSKLLFVACGDSSQADVIDLATRKSLRRMTFGDDPEAFDFSADGKTIFVSLEDEGALGFVDAASGKLGRSTPVGKEPEGVMTAPDGKRVYVTSEVANMVHAIDTATGAVLKNITVGKRPRRFAITPDGRELWVTNELSASVSILSTADLKVIGTVRFEIKGLRADDITPVGITMTRDGKRALVALGRANRLAFVDVATRKLGDTVLVGKRAWHVALSRDESQAWVTNGLSDDVTVVDVAGAKALKSVPVGRVPYMTVLVE